MIPAPLVITATPSGTVMSTPPKIAFAMIVTSRSSSDASRRSISTPPNSANAWNVRGTTHDPLRVAPPKIAIAGLLNARPPTGIPAGRCSGCGHRVTCGRPPGAREVGDQRLELAVGLGAVRRAEPFVELVEVEAAVAGGQPELLGDVLAVEVGGADVLALGRLAHRAEGTRARRRARGRLVQ